MSDMNKRLDVMYSSLTGEWETPQDVFDELNKEFNFNYHSFSLFK